MTHICVSKLTIIGSDNGLSPNRHQAIIQTNTGILLIGPLRTNFNEILIEIHTFLFKKIHLKMSSGKWRPFCLGLNPRRTAHLVTRCLCCCWIRFAIIKMSIDDLRQYLRGTVVYEQSVWQLRHCYHGDRSVCNDGDEEASDNHEQCVHVHYITRERSGDVKIQNITGINRYKNML